jgi:dTMP kinase
MAQSHSLIAIEGLDGTGKTTVVNLLTRRLSESGVPAIALHLPLAPFDSLKTFVSETCSVHTELFFHLMSVSYASARAERETVHHTVICDRYIHSTLAYHRARGAEFDLPRGSLGIRWPDRVYYLTVADESVRHGRIERRGTRDLGEAAILETAGLADRIDAEYRRIGGLEIIPTDAKSPDEIAIGIVADVLRRSGS